MRALLPVERNRCMYASVCLPVCMYLQYVYIYIRILNLYICASQPVLSVCLSYLSYLAYPYLPDSSFLCVLSVFYSYLYIISIYILCLVSHLLYLSYCYLINIYPIHLSIYRSISVSTFCSIKSYSTLCILSIPPCHVYIRYLYISCVQFGWTESRGPAA